MKGFKRVGALRKFRLGEGVPVAVGRRRVAVFRLAKGFVAVEDRCPPRGAPLSDGPVTGTVVTCTWHGWEFDMARGACTADPDLPLARFAVRVHKGGVFVSLDPIPVAP